MKNLLLILAMILIGSPSFAASDLECYKLSEKNFKNFAMGFGLSLGILYMVGYNDGKNKNKINFDKKHMDKMKELIIEGCSNNPDSDMLTLFRTGMRDDFNNGGKGIKPDFKGYKKDLKIMLELIGGEKEKDLNCFETNISTAFLKEYGPLFEPVITISKSSLSKKEKNKKFKIIFKNHDTKKWAKTLNKLVKKCK